MIKMHKFILQKKGIDIAKVTQSSSGVVMVEWDTANLPTGQLAKTDHWESLDALKTANPDLELVTPPDRIAVREAMIEQVKAAAREQANARASAIIEAHQTAKLEKKAQQNANI